MVQDEVRGSSPARLAKGTNVWFFAGAFTEGQTFLKVRIALTLALTVKAEKIPS
jgi:hypothetical protein